MTTGEGGMVTTNNQKLAQKIKLFEIMVSRLIIEKGLKMVHGFMKWMILDIIIGLLIFNVP